MPSMSTAISRAPKSDYVPEYAIIAQAQAHHFLWPLEYALMVKSVYVLSIKTVPARGLKVPSSESYAVCQRRDCRKMPLCSLRRLTRLLLQ